MIKIFELYMKYKLVLISLNMKGYSKAFKIYWTTAAKGVYSFQNLIIHSQIYKFRRVSVFIIFLAMCLRGYVSLAGRSENLFELTL